MSDPMKRELTEDFKHRQLRGLEMWLHEIHLYQNAFAEFAKLDENCDDPFMQSRIRKIYTSERLVVSISQGNIDKRMWARYLSMTLDVLVHRERYFISPTAFNIVPPIVFNPKVMLGRALLEILRYSLLVNSRGYDEACLRLTCLIVHDPSESLTAAVGDHLATFARFCAPERAAKIYELLIKTQNSMGAALSIRNLARLPRIYWPENIREDVLPFLNQDWRVKRTSDALQRLLTK